MRDRAPPASFTYRRPPEPRIFPVEEKVPETRRHLFLRTTIFDVLRLAFGDRATLGSDQFVYWNAAEPRRCLAPDVFLRDGTPDHFFDSWQTWKRGAPELAIEIVSAHDAPDIRWEEKLARYHELGVEELVRYDDTAAEGARLRVWDRVDGDLVERTIDGDRTPSAVVPGTWVVAPAENGERALRLARDAAGKELYPTPVEAERSKLDAANARIAELEAALRKRGDPPH